jgi:SAM-dependent methyltransferase
MCRAPHITARVHNAGVTTFDDLIAEATAAPFTGWDFSWLNARSSSTELPWSYREIVAAHAAAAATMLDMGTGGGEWLAGFDRRPGHTVATESWPPNVPVAANTLRPLGIPVLQCDAAPDNVEQERLQQVALAERSGQQPAGGAPGDAADRGLLPFRDGAFDLVINRHESFRGDEVCRVLAPGGAFVSQQVDYHSDDDLYRVLGLDPPGEPQSWLPLAEDELASAGLEVTTATAGETVTHFDHVGALVYYLRIVSWAIPEYDLESFMPRLREVAQDDSAWPLPNSERRFLVAARKPAR